MLKVTRAHDGTLIAQTEPAMALLGNFLEEDVQESESHCRELLAALEKVSSGEENSRELTGNAHTVIMNREGVRIEGEFDEEESTLHLSWDDFIKVLEQWLSFMGDDGEDG